MVYDVKAKIERKGINSYWLKVGKTPKLKDGRIIMTLDALPLHSNGVLMLYPDIDEDIKKDLEEENG